MNREGTRVPVTNLRTLLRSLVLNTEGEDVTVRELLRAVGRRAYGPVLLLLGFIAVSPLTIIPGANWFVGTVTLIFALQIVVGRRTPWLPKSALDFSFKRSLLVQGVGAGEKYAHMVDALVRPRLVFLTESPFVQVVAMICVFAALITYPLGLVPLGPLLPSLTVLLFGLALTARDGVVVLLAALTFGGAALIVIRMLPKLLQLWPF
ncbi:exopolysaccharide biosynthesis protein [Hyphomonas sp.]|uniref:exopolysaccharide biosynthesis protein n=1 Tax=Hyphomonas sp. TaxID=87 RepID=UPI00391D3FC9